MIGVVDPSDYERYYDPVTNPKSIGTHVRGKQLLRWCNRYE